MYISILGIHLKVKKTNLVDENRQKFKAQANPFKNNQIKNKPVISVGLNKKNYINNDEIKVEEIKILKHKDSDELNLNNKKDNETTGSFKNMGIEDRLQKLVNQNNSIYTPVREVDTTKFEAIVHKMYISKMVVSVGYCLVAFLK